MPKHDDTAQSSDGQPTDQSDNLTDHEALLRVSALRYAEDVTRDETGKRRVYHAVWTATVAVHREDEPNAEEVLDAAEDVLGHESADGPAYRFDTYTRALKHLGKRGLTDEPVFAEGSA